MTDVPAKAPGEKAADGASLAAAARDRAVSAVESGKEEVAGGIADAAQALHRSGEELGPRQDWLARLVEQGASELDGFASTLRTNDLQGLLGKVDDFARRQPAVFFAAAVALGFAAARVGKAATDGSASGASGKEVQP